MTELIPGKRYRWTVEGLLDGGILILEDAHIPGDLIRRYGVFEVLPDPLPTTPGSVVRWKEWSGELRTLSRETGRLPWRDVNSPHLCFSDEEVQGATVLFDVGP